MPGLAPSMSGAGFSGLRYASPENDAPVAQSSLAAASGSFRTRSR